MSAFLQLHNVRKTYGGGVLERSANVALETLSLSLDTGKPQITAVVGEKVPREAMGQVRGLFLQKLDDVATQIARLSQLQRELMSSLSYLEECGTCASPAKDDAPGAVACCGCTSHDDAAPALVEQTQKLPVLSQSQS